MNRSLGWFWGQLDEILGRPALVQPRTSHRRRSETQRLRLSLPSAQEVGNSFWTAGVDRWFLSICNREATGGASVAISIRNHHRYKMVVGFGCL
jgi:hypothetical protein